MSKTDTGAANAASNPAAKAEDQDGQVQDTTENSTQISASEAARVLAESKKWKEKAQKLEKEAEARKKQELDAEGKAAERAKFFEEKYENLKKASVKKAIDSAVKAEAMKANCADPEAVLVLGPKDILQYDEETLEVFGADKLVEEVKRLKPYLFSKPSSATINSATPGGNVGTQKKLTAQDIAKMAQEKKNELWAKAMKK